MKVLFFTRKKKRTQTPAHIRDALASLGHDVRNIYYGRWRDALGGRIADAILLARARAFRPDLVLVWKDTISVRLFERLGGRCRRAVVCVDWFPDPPKKMCELGAIADLFLLTNTGQLDEYRRLGVRRPVFWPQACDTAIYRPVADPPPEFASDVAFIGKPGLPHRQELLRLLGARFDLKIWGAEWAGLAPEFRGVQHREILPNEYGAVCSAAKVIVGCDAARGIERCFSNRLWLTLGCGGFLVTDYVPAMETMFENGRHLVWYRTPEECVELIERYLAQPEERRRIADAGRTLIAEKHTYVHRARELVELVAGVATRG